MRDRSYQDFGQQKLEELRVMLREAPGFTCACCGQSKSKGEASGTFLYKAKEDVLRKTMEDRRAVGPYVLCLECVDSLPDYAIHQRVTRYLAGKGLFG